MVLSFAGKRGISAATIVMVTALMGGLAQQKANAVVINFESPTYAAGNLNNQNTWLSTNSANNTGTGLIVTSYNGDQKATTALESVSNYPWYYYHFTTADLGAAYSSTTSVLNYSFDITFNNDPAAIGNTASELRPQFGGFSKVGTSVTPTPFSNFEILANGTFIYGVGSTGTNQIAKNGSGGTFIAQKGITYTVNGEFDLPTGTFTLFVNGVQQRYGGSGDLVLKNTPTDLYMTLRSMNNTATNFVELSIDNIKLESVPEPAAFGLLALTVGGLLVSRRKY